MRSDREKAKKKKSFHLLPQKPILAILALLLLAADALFLMLLSTLNLLPGNYLFIIFCGLILVTLLAIALMNSRKKKTVKRKIGTVLSLLLLILLCLGSFYLYNTYDTFHKISKQQVQTEDFHVVALKEGNHKALGDIKGKVLYTSQGETGNYKEAKSLLMAEADVSYEPVEGFLELGYKLIDEEGKKHDEIIFLSAANYDILCEEIKGFRKNTTVLHTISIEIETNDIAKRIDVTEDSFNVYISGIDTFGSINTVARSDVNMIMTVNPKEKTILLTSIPRDMYIPLHSYGVEDKLTHSGIYGIEETVTTVEDWLDVEINYYVRVNFTTLVDIVDAIGGIDVESEYAFSSSVSDYSYVEGTNHLDGEAALYFARERKSLSGGDNERVKNQQRVLKGIIDKITGSTVILTRYTSLLNAVEDEMQTNLANDDISALVKMQLADLGGWNIENNAVEGQGASKPTYSMGSVNLSVIIPDPESVAKAQKQINEVMLMGN